MLLKVCGIREKSNLAFLNESKADWIGFIFYDKSKRFFDGGNLVSTELSNVKKKKIGVFVNAGLDEIESRIRAYSLDGVQLHGDESPELCAAVKALGVLVLKAFGITSQLPPNLNDYQRVVDYILFDTKGAGYGGTGKQFDWKLLNDYPLRVPFILSGGIGPDDAAVIRSLKFDHMAGIDVNSKFEIAPGLKDEQLLADFIEEIK